MLAIGLVPYAREIRWHSFPNRRHGYRERGRSKQRPYTSGWRGRFPCPHTNSGSSVSRRINSCIASSDGRSRKRPAASSTAGSNATSPTRVEEQARPGQHPVHRAVDGGRVAQRLVPADGVCGRSPHGARAIALIVCTATPRCGRARRAPRSRPRTPGSASSGSCTAAARSRRRSARGCAGAWRRLSCRARSRR